MKMTLLLTLSFLILSLLSANALELVLDTDGEPLSVGYDYNILSVFRGAGGGGVTLGRNRKGTDCPLDVVQEPVDVLLGLPVTFSPVSTKEGLIHVQKDLNIRFSVGATICIQPTLWKLDQFDAILGRSFVTTNGVLAPPGPEMLSWFKIEKSDADYKLVFCPPVCENCRISCGDISVFTDDKGVKRLALSSTGGDRPLKVKFKKA